MSAPKFDEVVIVVELRRKGVTVYHEETPIKGVLLTTIANAPDYLDRVGHLISYQSYKLWLLIQRRWRESDG